MAFIQNGCLDAATHTRLVAARSNGQFKPFLERRHQPLFSAAQQSTLLLDIHAATTATLVYGVSKLSTVA